MRKLISMNGQNVSK